MNTLKIIIVSILLTLGMVLLSIQTTTEEGLYFHYVTFFLYSFLMYALYNYTKLFQIKMRYTTSNVDLLLVQFLHEQNLLKLFLKRLNEQGKSNGRDDATLETLKWEETPEGQYFWYQLNQDYIVYKSRK